MFRGLWKTSLTKSWDMTKVPSALYSSMRRGRGRPPASSNRTVPMTAASQPRKTVLNTRLHKLSGPLAKVCGNDTLPRTEVTKGIWRYIKENDLQKKNEPRIVKCDPLLKKVLNKNEIDMFKIGKGIQKHILEPVPQRKKI